MQLLLLFFVGAIVGVTGRPLMPQRLPGEGVISVLLGTAGAITGAMGACTFGLCHSPADGPGVLSAMLGAMTLLYAYGRYVFAKQRA